MSNLTDFRVPPARTISPGDGLSGGGDLTANITLAVDSSVIRTTGNQTIDGVKTFSTQPQTTSEVLTKGMKNITISSADPSGGADGDVWLQY